MTDSTPHLTHSPTTVADYAHLGIDYGTDDAWQKFEVTWHASDLSAAFRQSMVDIGDNIQLCVEAMGNPNHPPLLFVTGLGSQMTFWSEGFLRRFVQAGFFVLRFDNRDTGLSSKIRINGLPRLNTGKMMAKTILGLSNRQEPVAYNLSDMAEDTARLIKRLKFDKISLVGASMGGLIIQIVAARYPNYIDTLNLLFTTPNRAFLQLPYPKQFYTFIRRPESHSERDIVRHSVWFMTTVGTPGHLDIKGTRAVAQERYQRCFHPLGIAQQINAILASGSILRYTKRIKAPTLIIHGSKDGLIPPSHGRYLAKIIPNSTFKLVDGMGHDLPVYYQPHLVHLIKQHYQHIHPEVRMSL